MVTGSHNKTINFGALFNYGKQLFIQQYNRFDSSLSFIRYLEQLKKKFKKFVIFVDRAAQHRSKVVKEYLQRNKNAMIVEYFPVGSPKFNAVKGMLKTRKVRDIINYYPNFLWLRHVIARYYRTRRFNLDVKKYLLRSKN